MVFVYSGLDYVPYFPDIFLAWHLWSDIRHCLNFLVAGYSCFPVLALFWHSAQSSEARAFLISTPGLTGHTGWWSRFVPGLQESKALVSTHFGQFSACPWQFPHLYILISSLLSSLLKIVVSWIWSFFYCSWGGSGNQFVSFHLDQKWRSFFNF